MSPSQSSVLSGIGFQADFVHRDVDALARHMRDCARAHGRMASVKAGLQCVHAMAAGRIVTFAFAAMVIGAGVATLA